VHKARLISAAKPHANAFLSAIPSDIYNTRLQDKEWSILVAYRLGLKLFQEPHRCPSINCRMLVDVYGHHCLRCRSADVKDWCIFTALQC
jgi:hypothetical protein